MHLEELLVADCWLLNAEPLSFRPRADAKHRLKGTQGLVVRTRLALTYLGRWKAKNPGQGDTAGCVAPGVELKQ